MFNKKACQNCREKIKGSYNFCPHCGYPSKDIQQNDGLGMLGGADEASPLGELKLPMGMNMLFNSLVKSLDKQFTQLEKQKSQKMVKQKLPENGGMSISIATFGNMPEMMMKSLGMPMMQENQKQKKVAVKKLPKNVLKNFGELEKAEPIINIRRLSNKLIYEIELPGVKSINNVSVTRLEDSIEIKAVSKEKAYLKILSVNFPIIDYELTEDKLVLELEAGN